VTPLTVRRLVVVLVLAFMVLPAAASAHGSHHDRPPDLGPNVKIFDPSMSTAEIDSALAPGAWRA
jgi:hypothetical protein